MDTGERVVKYSGRGVDTLGGKEEGREKKIRRKQVKEFVELKERGERVERQADGGVIHKKSGEQSKHKERKWEKKKNRNRWLGFNLTSQLITIFSVWRKKANKN